MLITPEERQRLRTIAAKAAAGKWGAVSAYTKVMPAILDALDEPLGEKEIVAALAKWLNIDEKKVMNYYLVHACKPLRLDDLVKLLRNP